MPEILTESFCERCGTRYTFESAAPKRRPLGRVRTLSKGLRNFVLSDETSLSEALADARIDEEREASAHQLDAFHKTFNFCMSCRQYTCSNCWNDHEGRCLSCAPHLGTEILPAAFPDLDPHAGLAMAGDRQGSNGHLVESEWPDVDLDSERLGRVFGAEDARAGIDLEHDAPVEADEAAAALPEPDVVAGPEPVEVIAAIAEPTAEALEPQAESEAVAEPEVAAEAEVGAEFETEVAAEPGTEVAAATEPVTAVAEPAEAADDERPAIDLLGERGLAPQRPITPRTGLRRPGAAPTTQDERAAAAAAQTSALLAKFRPGQSLDEALAAYEEELARARTDEDVTQPVASTPTTAPDEPADASPAREAAAAPAPTPEAPAAPATAARDDIELPAWPTAPAATPTLADRPAAQPRPVEPPAASPPAPAAPPAPQAQPAPPAAPPPAATPPSAAPATPASPWSLTPPVETDGEPQWPAAPQWPTGPQWPTNRPAARGDRAPVVPQLAGRPLVPDRSVDALWAASSSEVLARPAGPAPSVQPCVNCGLSLSANARFCRRCGTRQG